jgi:hypothetical protein
MNDTNAIDSVTVDLETPPRSRWSEWLLRRIPSMISWDGLVPLISPLCTLAAAQGPHFLQSVTVTIVPMAIALVRTKIAHRQLVRVCGNADDRNRQSALGMAIVLLLALEVTFSTLVLGKPIMDWETVAMLYVAYFACITYALRPPKPSVADVSPESHFSPDRPDRVSE